MPQAAPVLLAKPDSAIAKRGAFAQKNLWVTPHADAVRAPVTSSDASQDSESWRHALAQARLVHT